MKLALGRNVGIALASTAAQVAVALLSTPLIISALGIDAFGLWSVAQAGFMIASLSSAGLGTAFQRSTALAHARNDRPAVAAVFWTALVYYAALGALLGLVIFALAGPLADLFGAPSALREQTVRMFQITGATIAIALVGAVLGSTLAGMHRFGTMMGSVVAGSLTFLAGVVVVRATGGGLGWLACAALASQCAMVVIRTGALKDVLFATRPRRLERAERRATLSFSSKLQLYIVAGLVNQQTDRLVVGIVASTATLGQLGVGVQLADAIALLGSAASSPVNSRLAHEHEVSPANLAPLYLSVQRTWALLSIGATVVGAACAYPLVTAWLGSGYREAALFGAILILAQGWYVLTRAAMGYLLALGLARPEVQYAVTTMALNIAGTFLLGVLFGAFGVVSATLVAYVTSTVWFFRSLRPKVPGYTAPGGRRLVGVMAAALSAGGLAFLWTLVCATLLPSGIALVPAGLGVGLAIAGYMAVVTRTVPTPRNVRAALAGLGSASAAQERQS